jgi:sulfatase maturation enzyme AslB (radical SAM superfamily)
VQRKRYPIDTLDLMTATSCNLECRECYGHMDLAPERSMDLRTGILATDFAFRNLAGPPETSHLSIMFFGGEPLLNWDFVTTYVDWILLERPKSKFNYTLEIFTNGILLDKGKMDYLLRNDIRIYISLDGNFDDQCVRRPMALAHYNTIIDSIRYILVHRPSQKCGPFIYTVVRASTINNITAKLHYFYDIGIRNVQISKDLDEELSAAQRTTLLSLVVTFLERHKDMNIMFNPENSADCLTCRPKAVLVYPDGSIFDLCMVCIFNLYSKGMLPKEEFDSVYIGTLADTEYVLLDIDAKKRIIRDRRSCPTMSCQPDYLDTVLNR